MPKKRISRTRVFTCQFPFADGRHCQMPVAESHSYLCLFHAERERRLLDQELIDSAPDPLAAELAALNADFRTANDVNIALSRLWKLIAARRIPPRTAATLAYLGGLIIQTLPTVKSELRQIHNSAYLQRIAQSTVLRPYPATTNPSHPAQASESESQAAIPADPTAATGGSEAWRSVP